MFIFLHISVYFPLIVHTLYQPEFGQRSREIWNKGFISKLASYTTVETGEEV